MEDWIQRAWTQPVTMPRQLFDDPQTEDFTLRSMMEDMKTNEIPGKILIVIGFAHGGACSDELYF